MTYIVDEKCIKCKYMDCVEVCPVDCFYEGENMLVIHPDECIDCGVCEPECPIEAIHSDADEDMEKWLEINKKYNLVIGSRVSQRNFIYKYNYYGVIFLTKIINFLFIAGLTDVASMPKLVESKFIKKINLKSNGFDLDFELITKSLRLGAKIDQVDVKYYPRSVKEGKKIRPIKDGLLALLRILKDRLVLKKNIYNK